MLLLTSRRTSFSGVSDEMDTGPDATTRRELTKAKDFARIGELSAHTDHRALGLLRSLCERDLDEEPPDVGVLNDDYLPDCPLEDSDICIRLIRPSLQSDSLAAIIDPILTNIIESNRNIYDPLKTFDEPLPGISDVAGTAMSVLDFAAASKKVPPA